MLIKLSELSWFFGIDIGIQLIGAIIALLIAFYGYKCYKLASTKTDLYFSLAFLLLGASFFIYALLVPAIYIYYNFYQTADPGILLKGSHILNFIFIFAALTAYTILNLLYSKIKKPNAILTVSILILALAYYIYYFRSFFGLSIISALLVLQITFNTYRNWLKKRTTNPLLVVLAFALITLANIFFAMGNTNLFFTSARYLNISLLFGHIAQLLGYSSLLAMLLRINYGHRKKK